jgi:hypothetical protein
MSSVLKVALALAAILLAVPLGEFLFRLAQGMTFWGWIALLLIALFFVWGAIKLAAKLFWEGLFAGLGVRASGVIKRLSKGK